MTEQNEGNDQAPAEQEQQPAEQPAHPVTEADPEGDGLDKGQATADVHGDVLGI